MTIHRTFRSDHAAEEHRPFEPPVGEVGSAGDGMSILVVDDNADVADALSLLLQMLGCRVSTAASGAEALSAMEASVPRMALLDIGLPDIDGYELARRLRRRYPSDSGLRLVAISGYGLDEDRRESRAAGFDEYLTKPVGRKTLEALLGRGNAAAR